MPTANYDSDSDSGSEYSVTQTQLAVPDGPLEGDDGANPLVSRMGGRVAWLPTSSIPPASVAACMHCGNLMELLVQIFAPLDDSPYDRAVLVWGCARNACQRQGNGSIRALRILSHNARWAAKIEKKRQKQEAKEAARKIREEEQRKQEEANKTAKKANPFASMGSGASAAGGLGGALFGSAPAQKDLFAKPSSIDVSEDADKAQPQAHSLNEDSGEEDADEDDKEEDEEQRIAEELAVKAAIDDKRATWTASDWSRDAPAYEPAQYLNTYAEPSSSAYREDEAKRNKKQMQKLKTEGLSGAEMKGWEAEKYESMVANDDDVFDRFVKRIRHDGQQVVRYEFGGIPLPFHSKGPAYEKLWPSKEKRQGTTVVSGAAFSADSLRGSSTSVREYAAASVPPCPRCGSPRTFEMQLMPNLVNLLRPNLLQSDRDGGGNEAKTDHAGTQRPEKHDAEAERRREIEEALGRKLPSAPDADGITRDDAKPAPSARDDLPSPSARRTGLQWNTAMVFVCQADCHMPVAASSDKSSSWAEEVVEMQIEHEA